MSHLAPAAGLLSRFKAAVGSFSGGPVPKATSDLLLKLKLAIMEFPSLPPAMGESPSERQEVLIAREALELASLLSTTAADAEAFERHVIQVKAYYADYRSLLPDSEARPLIVGLYLIFLLVENRLADFHSELEHLSDADKANALIAYPILLEEWLMEGSYNKILALGVAPPTPYYQRYVQRLVDTVRDELCDCSAASYDSLSVEAAQRMMVFASPAELLAYIAAKHPTWHVEAGVIHFQAAHKARLDIPSMQLVNNMLAYATELDRIV